MILRLFAQLILGRVYYSLERRLIKAGCCGFAVKGGAKTYYKLFDVVELQSTFYRLPKIETAERWRREAPEWFEFVEGLAGSDTSANKSYVATRGGGRTQMGDASLRPSETHSKKSRGMEEDLRNMQTAIFENMRGSVPSFVCLQQGKCREHEKIL